MFDDRTWPLWLPLVRYLSLASSYRSPILISEITGCHYTSLKLVRCCFHSHMSSTRPHCINKEIYQRLKVHITSQWTDLAVAQTRIHKCSSNLDQFSAADTVNNRRYNLSANRDELNGNKRFNLRNCGCLKLPPDSDEALWPHQFSVHWLRAIRVSSSGTHRS